jgi:hypothetical protein
MGKARPNIRALRERTVSRLVRRRRTPPSQTWRTFLTNHVRDLVSLDFFKVPTAGLRVRPPTSPNRELPGASQHHDRRDAEAPSARDSHAGADWCIMV